MKMVLLFIALVIALLGTIVLRISGFSPGATGVIAHRTIPDGTRFLVTQTYDVDDLGYKVDFYLKTPGSGWRWCYLAHDSAWRDGRIDYDEAANTATIWNGSTIRGRLTLHDMNWERPDVKNGWNAPAPQDLRDPPFKPADWK